MYTPEPDYDDPKELYAFFGLAFYKAQVLEQGLLNLTVALRLSGSCHIDSSTIENLFGKWGSKTLGHVLRETRDLIEFPNDLDNRLQKALVYRNRLAHSFFVEHDIDLMSDAGRCRMIGELGEIHSFLASVDKELDPIWQAAWERIGMTDEMYVIALRAMRQEAGILDDIA